MLGAAQQAIRDASLSNPSRLSEIKGDDDSEKLVFEEESPDAKSRRKARESADVTARRQRWSGAAQTCRHRARTHAHTRVRARPFEDALVLLQV